MKKTEEDLKQLIFDLMNGYLVGENNIVEDKIAVEDEFAEGKICYNAYAEIMEAYQRICQRLGDKEEDEDVEIIINHFNTIIKHLCMKMFDYGYSFSQPSIK